MLKLTLRGLLAHKVRLVATAVAVMLGVAFMAGTQVLTGSVSESFDKVFAVRVARLHREPRLAERWLAPGGTLLSEYD